MHMFNFNSTLYACVFCKTFQQVTQEVSLTLQSQQTLCFLTTTACHSGYRYSKANYDLATVDMEHPLCMHF